MMKITYTLLAFILITAPSLFAQAPSVKWQKCLGGIRDDYGHSMIKTSDGGYILAGSTMSYDGDVHGNHPGGNSDAWVVKLSSFGNIEWQKCLGGNDDDAAYSVVQTSDGGYAFAGYTRSDSGDVSGNHGRFDMWIVKLNPSGDIVWQKCLGGTFLDYAYSIIQTLEGGYAIAGETYSNDGDVSGFHENSTTSPDAWVVKLTNKGEIEWQKTIGGSGRESARSIVQLPDSSFFFVGSTDSKDGDVSGIHGGLGYQDGWLVKLSSQGDILWQKCIGTDSSDYLQNIILANDSGYILTGASNGFSKLNTRDYDFWVLNIDNNGSTIWQSLISGNKDEGAVAITKSFDGTYLVCGATNSDDSIITDNHGITDILIAKLTSDGKNLWHKCFGGSDIDGTFGVIQNNDGSIFLGGRTKSQNGDVSGRHGITSNSDFWIAELTTPESVDEKISSLHSLSLSTYPNPASKSVTLRYVLPAISSDVSISITDINGKQMREVHQANVLQGSNEVALDVSELSEGTYYITVSTEGISETTVVQVVK